MESLDRYHKITMFKKIKTDLKNMYDILEENPTYENYIKDDLLNIQRMTNNVLSKLKKTISFARDVKSQKGLFDE